MSEITKFLMDDHARLKRAFRTYRQDPSSVEAALYVCDQIWIHTTLEEEMLYPILREVDPDEAEACQDEHQRINEVMASIDQMEPGDPALERTMTRLQTLIEQHAREEERSIFPKLSQHDALPDLGRTAFTRHQELVNQRPPKAVRKMSLANTGWGGGGPIANAGW